MFNNRLIVRLTRALLVGLVLAGITLTAPTSAGAAEATARVGCVGTACSGQDPNAMGCGPDAMTADEFLATHANSGRLVRVELRQSRACRARWLRVTAGDGSGGCGDSSHVRMLDYNANGVVIQTGYKTFNLCEGQIVTRMVGRASNSYRMQFGFRSEPYGWDSHPTYAPSKGQMWGAW